jgi:threonine dehydrogenase-like Zn-dependent dehydrogenase
MRAAVLAGPHSIAIHDVAEPNCQPGEVVVDVELAGVCGSDVALFDGRRAAAYPLILGHEAIGRLSDSGTAVVIEPNIPCGSCSVCRRHQATVCPNKRSLGVNAPGVFAERVAVAAEYVHPLPHGLDPLDAVCVEPLAVAVHALGVANVQAGDPVAVVGCGMQGLLLVQLALARGAEVLAVDRYAEPLAAAAELGAAVSVAQDWAPSIVFEAAGSAAAVARALEIASNGGTVVVVGLATDAVSVVPLEFVRRGLRLLSSLIYDHPHDFVCAIDLVSSRAIRPGKHVRTVVDLAHVHAALSKTTTGGKAVIDVAGVLARL